MNTTIYIALVNSHSLFRQGVGALLKEYHDLETIIDVQNGAELFAQISDKRIDITLLGIDSSEEEGMEILMRLAVACPETHIIVLTSSSDEAFMFRLIELGAGAIIPKNKKIADVVDAVHSLYRNNLYHSEEMSRVLMLGLHKRSRPLRSAGAITLSERELEVMKLLCEQNTNREIADILKLSPRTIDTYRENIFSKTGARNIAGVVRYAIGNNLID